MASADKRDALRVPCEFPIRVYGQLRELTGRILDISRTGAQVSVPLSRLMNTEQVDVASLAHAVEQVLGQAFQADLHFEMLGPLVRKRLSVVRVGQVDVDGDSLSVGCRFAEALNDDEAMMLGVGLPPIGVTAVSAFRDVPAPRHRNEPDLGGTAGPRPRAYEGILHACTGFTAEPLVGSTDGVAEGSVILAVPVDTIPGATSSFVSTVIETVRGAYGPQPRLEVLDGLHMVWAGETSLQEIELPGRASGHALLLLQAL